jgi:GTP-binding protein
MKFVDHVRIHAKAGDGGDGCCSFRREKFVPHGGPDGGDGGDGGSIILKADVHTDNLASLYYEPNVRANRGAHGQGKDKHGRNGESLTVKVPVGTLIFRLPEQFHPHISDSDSKDTGNKGPLDLRKLEPIVDLNEPGAEFVLCQGGRGGKGNTHFKSSTNRAPRQTTEGELGEEGWFALELQTIADVGLVGYPNAGKSTLLGKLSAAHPKVAPYPFTTLNPVVGVVELDGFKRKTVADIPGLIEGAHENKGLGHEFLRHIERCRLLLFVLDMAGSEGRDPIEDFRTLRQELKLYDPRLAARSFAVVANKMDLADAAGHLRQFKAKFRKVRIIPISAKKGDGIARVKELLAKAVKPTA